MAQTMCNKGHLFDMALGTCPVCAQEGSNLDGYSATTPVSQQDMWQADPVAMGSINDPGATVPATGFDAEDIFKDAPTDEYGQTTAVGPEETHANFSPVVGWLICVKGPNRGRDYRIHVGNNFVGRDQSMDICLDGDTNISRIKAATISYDDISKEFFIGNSEGQNMPRLNGKAVPSHALIEKYDRIQIGMTEFVFVPLCGEEFNWQEN